jgi:hypothetical protein
MRNRASRRCQPDEPEPVNVRQWLVDGLLEESVLVVADDGSWPPAVLDGQPFPLAAAFLGLVHQLGPVEHPVPHACCSIDEQLRARRLASELHAELALEMERVDWPDGGMLGYDYDED